MTIRLVKTTDAGFKPLLKKILDRRGTREGGIERRVSEIVLQKSWQYRDPLGMLLGQRITPLERVGVYVPGGKASYPSTVLMNAIPAKIAGVKESESRQNRWSGKYIRRHRQANGFRRGRY